MSPPTGAVCATVIPPSTGSLSERLRLAEQVIEWAGCGVILFDRRGHIVEMTSRTAELLAGCFPRQESAGLPPRLQTWITEEQRSRSATVDSGPVVFSDENGDPRLIVQLSPQGNQGHFALFIRRVGLAPVAAQARSFGLSPREAEVLQWMVRGKTNPEIAIILAISPGTVKKHLEHIFEKLGVGTRTAAVMCALETGRCPLLAGQAPHRPGKSGKVSPSVGAE